MLRDHRLDRFGNVFDDPRAASLTPLQSASAVGTTRQAMRLATIDLDRSFATNTGVPHLGTGLLAPLGLVRLGIDRHHPRRRGRRNLFPSACSLKLGQTPVQREGEQRDRFAPERMNPIGRRLIEFTTQGRVDDPL
jgi:hypothetical protein